jgi:ribonuclease T1
LIFQGKPVLWTGLASSGSEMRRALWKWGLTAVVGSVVLAGGTVYARAPAPASALPAVALTALPAEARNTYRLIAHGGPFPYAKDGIVFGNRERRLPSGPRGSYREYTVRTPGAQDRGARRIVCTTPPPSPPEVCYYTEDHYASFRRIQP